MGDQAHDIEVKQVLPRWLQTPAEVCLGRCRKVGLLNLYAFNSRWLFPLVGFSPYCLSRRCSLSKMSWRTRTAISARISTQSSGWAGRIPPHGMWFSFFRWLWWLCCMPESCAPCGSMVMMTINSHINRRLVLLNVHGSQNTGADLRAWIRWLDVQFGKEIF